MSCVADEQFAVVDVECNETIMKLQARDQRITELNKQILKLNEEMREQVRCQHHPLCASRRRCVRGTTVEAETLKLFGVRVCSRSGTRCSSRRCA